MSYHNLKERAELICKLKIVFGSDLIKGQSFKDNREMKLIHDYALMGHSLKYCRKLVAKHEMIYEKYLVVGVPTSDWDIYNFMINGLN